MGYILSFSVALIESTKNLIIKKNNSDVSAVFAAYVIAIKRTSIIMSAILDSLFFKEEIKGRVSPILVMLVGLLFVIFS